MTSYSKEIKKSLLEIKNKKNCCSRMKDDMEKLFTLNSSERAELIANSANHFKCQGCFSAYLRGLFIFCGNVTAPSKQYHLELSFESEDERNCADFVISEQGFAMKRGERKGRFILYVKSSSEIEDFFALIGATSAVFDLMNSKIMKEISSQTNRQLNCDMANIKKTLKSAEGYIEAVKYLRDTDKILRLSEDLRETAKLRIMYPQSTMKDLALLHNPPISKSGVFHRLERIMEIYKELQK